MVNHIITLLNLGGNVLKRMFFVTVLIFGLLSFSYAQENNAKKFAGVWVGVIDAGGQTMTVIFKLQEKDGKLTGTGESPVQGGGAIALENITIAGNKIQFEISAVQAGFDGVYKEDKKVIDGTFVINQQGIPLVLTKDEKAAVEPEKKYDSIWEGSMAAQSGPLKIIVKIFKNADGTLGATGDIPDKGVKNIPVDSITLTEDILEFTMTSVGASYKGKIDKATMTAKGTFTKGAGEMALDLKKTDK
jgi:hypothetical protein